MTVTPLSPVALVGLGAMGSAMASHILASGRPVLGWARDAEAREKFATMGGTVVANLADLAAAPVVVSMVFDDAAVRDVALGPNGFVEALKPGAIHVVMATISPALSRALHDAHSARGQRYLAAPVFGVPEAAAIAGLSITCSGPIDAYQAVEPILATMGKSRWIGSEPEQAMMLKLMGNNVIFAAAAMVREMFELLRAGGIKDIDAKELIIDKFFPSPIYAGYVKRYQDQPLFGEAPPIVRKDNRLCLEAAEALGINLPLVRCMYEQMSH